MQKPPALASPARPKVLVAAAIICIVFGVFGLFGIISVVMVFANSWMAGMPGASPVTAAMLNDPTVRAFSMVSGSLNAATGGLLLAAGISLLQCREWARKAAIGWSIYHVLAAMVATYVSTVYIQPVMQKGMDAMLQERLPHSPAASQMSALMTRMSSVVGPIGAVIAILFSMVVAVTLIVLVTRPQCKAACRPAAV